MEEAQLSHTPQVFLLFSDDMVIFVTRKTLNSKKVSSVFFQYLFFSFLKVL